MEHKDESLAPENDSEREQLVQLCRQLGATESQAPVMANQLLKRAEQISRSRGVERTEAMHELISLMIKGRNGLA